MIVRSSRRKQWLLATTAGFVAVAALWYWTRNDLGVIVYNDTNQPFRAIAVVIGTEHRDCGALDARESVAFAFRAVKTSTDVRLSIDADPPLRWSGPSLASPTISRVTLRVNESGSVTMTLEKTWKAKIAGWLE